VLRAHALLLSPLFDSVGRVRMISSTYIVSGVLLAITGVILGSLTAATLTLCGAIIFFFASAGPSSAYLIVCEIFPLETRALCIAFFYAIGTAAGGIAGPLLFCSLIDNASGSGDITKIAFGYLVGAALMIAGGLVEAIFGRQGGAAGPGRILRRRRQLRTRGSPKSQVSAER
jgi:MFS family permease